jgi:membrane protease subunit HflK
MPWENKGGGPWGSGGSGGGGSGGSGGGGSGGGGPWGRGPGGGGGRQPDIEDFIRKGQDRFKGMVPGGLGGRGIAILILLLLIGWAFTGVYRVQADQQGVELRFGKWVGTTAPGLHWYWPYPIGDVETPSVANIQEIRVGYRSFGAERGGTSERDVVEESLMLTGDQNIIDIDFSVQWRISDAGKFLFRIRDPEATVKIAAESSMREIIGQSDLQPAMTEAREEIALNTRELLQKILDEYESGIEITQVQLQKADPPAAVIDAFDDVQAAKQDKERLQNQADAYRNDILPRARGEAQRMIQEAQGYKERLVNEATGEAERFLSVYSAYSENPEVTRRRMYLETMQNLLVNTEKVIMDRGVQSAVPYLPLNELRRQAAPKAN